MRTLNKNRKNTYLHIRTLAFDQMNQFHTIHDKILRISLLYYVYNWMLKVTLHDCKMLQVLKS